MDPAALAPARPAAVSREEIARRAFEIYEARDGSQGDALSDWLTAERELQERVGKRTSRRGRMKGISYH